MAELDKTAARLDTHEAVCAERWRETILRIKRLEAVMVASAGGTIALLATIALKMNYHESGPHRSASAAAVWV
jgi:hypothetical protein